MDLLAFDGGMGAAGDMLLGALLAAGADRAALAPVEAALDVHYDVTAVDRGGIQATAVTVRLDDTGADRAQDHEPDDSPDHDDSHDHGHSHQHDHSHEHDTAEGAGPSRTYLEVAALVESMGLPDPVEADALAIFERLGEAEAAVHGTDLESTQFHAVGADDAIADVVGAALLVADLAPDRVVTTPLAAGAGEVETSHGTYPVPPPAVAEIAGRADWSLSGGPVDGELLTPTGAAILAHYAEGVETLPPLLVRATGYGAGARDVPGRANVLRALVGDGGAALDSEPVRVLETNVDDVTPEVLGGLQETLADAGAVDVSIVPLTMKKARPGHLVRAIAPPAAAGAVARRLAEETGTLGVRETAARHRWVADRERVDTTVELDGEPHEVAVKVATDGAGSVYDVSAEYDDAAAVAAATGRPVRAVMRLAEAAARSALGGRD